MNFNDIYNGCERTEQLWVKWSNVKIERSQYMNAIFKLQKVSHIMSIIRSAHLIVMNCKFLNPISISYS